MTTSSSSAAEARIAIMPPMAGLKDEQAGRHDQGPEEECVDAPVDTALHLLATAA